MVRQNKKQLRKIIPALMAVVIAFFLLNITTLADSNGMGFSVTPILPENQNNPDIGYFDISMKKDTEQTISLNIHNLSNEEIKLEVETVTASTSATGKIDYSSKIKNDESLKYAFSEIAKPVEKEVLVPANKNKNISIKINSPKESFDGMILGSVLIKDITEKKETEESQKTGGVQILNEYEYIVGVVLRENSNKVAPDFELLDVNAEILHNRAGVVSKFRNPKPDAVKGAILSANITPKNDKTEIFSVKDFKIDMAPNSVMPFEFVDDKGYGISPGTYKLRAQIKYEGETWDFEQDFNVSSKNASNINNEAVNQQNQGNKIPAWAILLIIVGILLLILLIILLLKNKKEDKEENKNSKNL